MSRNWIYGRNVVLTGCSTGIGRDLALLLGKKYGCNILGIARNEGKLQSLKEELGDRFTYRAGDISREDFFYELAQELDEMGFQVDILINNAGTIQPFTQFSDLTDEQIQTVIDINFNSVLHACRAFIPYIKKSGYGGLVNISSASAILPVSGESIYSATKCAVKGLSEALYQELKGYGIYVGIIMPGPVRTDIYKAREQLGESKNKVQDNLIENIGVTSEKAAKKIISVMRRKKARYTLGTIAKLMNLGMSVMPRFTYSISAAAIKWLGKSKIKSFAPIFQEQRDNEAEIKAKIKNRKNITYKSADDAPYSEALKKDKPRRM